LRLCGWPDHFTSPLEVVSNVFSVNTDVTVVSVSLRGAAGNGLQEKTYRISAAAPPELAEDYYQIAQCTFAYALQTTTSR
jgi:hypothetical protein